MKLQGVNKVISVWQRPSA